MAADALCVRCTINSMHTRPCYGLHKTHVFSEVGLHPDSSTAQESFNRLCPFHVFCFNFIMDLLLDLHASLTVSSFHDGPKASPGDDPPAIEQIVAIAPIACRDSGVDRCCLRFLKALTK